MIDVTKPHKASDYTYIHDIKDKKKRQNARLLIEKHIELRKTEIKWIEDNLIKRLREDINQSQLTLKSQLSLDVFVYRTNRLSKYLIAFLKGADDEK